MDDLISRQAAIDALGDMVMNWTDSDYELGQLNQWKEDRKAIIDLPSAQPQRIKSIWADGRCLRCGEHAPFHPMASAYYESNFCPSCGADMRGEGDAVD